MSKKRLTIIILIIIAFVIAITLSYLHYKDKYIVSFETGTNEQILTQYIDKNSKVSEPIQPNKDGFVFVEWQLNGEKYDFNNKVDDNIVLTAKWIKEEYIKVNYETNSLYNIDSNKILKGTSINNLPTANKDGYQFIGWYLNDKLYNNEIVNDDVTLVAHYKNDKVNTTYKVGDDVTIIGSYSSSAYSIQAKYSKAIGWNRKILNILENCEYPYMVGNDSGVTGFFKANSIDLIN